MACHHGDPAFPRGASLACKGRWLLDVVSVGTCMDSACACACAFLCLRSMPLALALALPLAGGEPCSAVAVGFEDVSCEAAAGRRLGLGCISTR